MNSERTDLDRTRRTARTADQPAGLHLRHAICGAGSSARRSDLRGEPALHRQHPAYRVQAAGAEDYSSLSFRDLSLDSIRYSVRSFVPNLGEDDLRNTPTLYPTWVSRRYLALPSSLPQRVVDLSRQLTASAKTPYEKALAIQDYLRKLPYDPKILLPSGDFDAVDYFLFLQKGYCDYFGTTMAVLLRASGVPARVARGYLPGEYDWVAHRYVVRENRLHTWTEVYFPPYGWIEFEPTPGQPPITRPPGSLLDEPSPLPTPRAAGGAHRARSVGGGGYVGPGYPSADGNVRSRPAGLGALPQPGNSGSPPSQFAELIYQRMSRYGAWTGRPRRPSQTPGRVRRVPWRRPDDEARRHLVWARGPPARQCPPDLDAERVRTIADGYQAGRIRLTAPGRSPAGADPEGVAACEGAAVEPGIGAREGRGRSGSARSRGAATGSGDGAGPRPAGAYAWAACGSMASRRPSPSRFTAITVSMMARPGKVVAHQACRS